MIIPNTIFSVPVGATLFVDATNGNDSTAKRGRLDRPFATPTAAVSAAQSGDLIQLGPGTFSLGTGRVKLPNNVSLNGAGPQVTTIAALKSSTAGAIVNPGTNSTVSNLSIQGDLGQNNYSWPIGVDLLKSDTAATNVNLVNVFTNGWSDGLYFRNNTGLFPALAWKCFNCWFSSNYDTTQVNPIDNSQAWPITVEFFGCDFTPTWDGTTNFWARGIISSGWGSLFRVYGGSATVIGGTNDARGVDAENGAIIELYGTRLNVSSASTGNVYSLYTGQASEPSSNPLPTIRVGPGTVYDAGKTGNDGNPGLITTLGGHFVPTALNPKDTTAANRPAGTVGAMVTYSGNFYICTNSSTPTWQQIGLS
jgi:hypothetical protein